MEAHVGTVKDVQRRKQNRTMKSRVANDVTRCLGVWRERERERKELVPKPLGTAWATSFHRFRTSENLQDRVEVDPGE